MKTSLQFFLQKDRVMPRLFHPSCLQSCSTICICPGHKVLLQQPGQRAHDGSHPGWKGWWCSSSCVGRQRHWASTCSVIMSVSHGLYKCMPCPCCLYAPSPLVYSVRSAPFLCTRTQSASPQCLAVRRKTPTWLERQPALYFR